MAVDFYFYKIFQMHSVFVSLIQSFRFYFLLPFWEYKVKIMGVYIHYSKLFVISEDGFLYTS